MPAVSDLIENLFHTYRKPNGKEFTHQEVAEALQEFGVSINPSYLSKLRNGKIANPGRDTLLGLCQFFHVPASYFFPELEALTPSDAPSEESFEVALRSAGLPPEAEQTISGIFKLFRKRTDT